VPSRLIVACAIATVAFWAYTRTLLPGVDLGDTGGFQSAVLWPEVSARQAYPLYYMLAKPFVAAVSAANPARGLNLFSAITGAATVGLLAFAGATVTGSLAGGAVAGLLLAFSYTFWSQAIIAEVYGLHLALLVACLLALHAYAAKPTTGRLALFFGVYALSYGNHLGMILFIVPFTVFLLQTAPARELLKPRVVALAAVMAVAGALQYLPNLLAAGSSIETSGGWTARLAAFWFDVTKQDWRESMVLGVAASQTTDRLAMWWWDARQQFGVAGIALALAGVAALWRHSRRWATLLLLSYAVCTVFALTYNVGDSHVFFMPGHLITALFAGAIFTRRAPLHGAEWRAARARPAFALLVMLYAGWRGWSTWPFVDRHDDRRGEALIARLTLGVDDQQAVLVSQMNWQLENVLLYVSRFERTDLAWLRLADVLPHFPYFVDDNHAVSRDLIVTAEAAAEIAAAYGNRFELIEDGSAPAAGLSDLVRQIPEGSPYVLAVLTPPREEMLDPDVLADALATLAGGRAVDRSGGAYEVFAGRTGEPPSFHRAAMRPFEARFQVLNDAFTVRMDSWLPTDTFRRPGFGHVLRGRDHVLILERGVNLVWLNRDNQPSPPYYVASLFAPKPRYRVPVTTLRLAQGLP
jgi:hypothetical protein